MLKLIIFDMDGLMFDTEGVMFRAFLEITQKAGYHSTKEQFCGLLGLNALDIQDKYREYYGEEVDAEALYHQAGNRKMEILDAEGIPVKKGLTELLDEIDRLGMKKAVASGSDQHVIEDNVKKAGLAGRFDLLLSARQIKRGKPFPDIFLAVCRYFQIKPEEALVLEDSPNGVEAAFSGGIPVIHIPDFLELSDEQKKHCTAVLDSLDEAIPLIRSLGSRRH